MSKPVALNGYFKRGSTWTIGFTRKAFETLLDQTDPVYQAVRQAVRSVAVVAQYLSADAVEVGAY